MNKQKSRSASVAIFGSYNRNSIGDSLILLGLINSLSRILGKGSVVNVYCLTDATLISDKELLSVIKDSGLVVRLISIRSSKAQRLIGRILYKLLPVNKVKKHRLLSKMQLDLRELKGDYLLIGGGNLIMDLFEHWPATLSEVIDAWSQKGGFCTFLGVGAGPIKTEYGKSLLKESLQRTRSLIARDRPSLSLCQSQLCYNGGYVYPDMAFGLEINEQISRCEGNSMLGINISGAWGPRWPFKDPVRYRNMIQVYADIAETLVRTRPFKRIILIISNISDLQAAKDLERAIALKHFNLDILYSDYHSASPMSLIQGASQCELVIATRLHACIASALAGRKVIAISYQPKVIDVINGWLPGLKCYDIDKLIDFPDSLELSELSSIYSERQPCYLEELPRLRSLVDESIEIAFRDVNIDE